MQGSSAHSKAATVQKRAAAHCVSTVNPRVLSALRSASAQGSLWLLISAVGRLRGQTTVPHRIASLPIASVSAVVAVQHRTASPCGCSCCVRRVVRSLPFSCLGAMPPKAKRGAPAPGGDDSAARRASRSRSDDPATTATAPAAAAAAAEPKRAPAAARGKDRRSRSDDEPAAAAAAGGDEQAKKQPAVPAARSKSQRHDRSSTHSDPNAMEDESSSAVAAGADAAPSPAAESSSSGSSAKRAKHAHARTAESAASAAAAESAGIEEEMKEAAAAAPATSGLDDDGDERFDTAAAAADAADATAAAAGSDSEGEGEGEGEYSSRARSIDPSFSTLYAPSDHSCPEEVVDPSDPYSSSLVRQSTLLSQLAPLYVPPELPGLENERNMLFNLLRSTLEDQSNTACLLLGPSGGGKTVLVSSVFQELSASLAGTGRGFVRVHLNGLIQRDDTAAMRELVVQLCSSLEIEQFTRSTKFDEYLEFLRKVLAGGTFSNTPLYVILDHFEEFAARPKQTLLYNLCDLLQHPQATISLVGVSTQLDAYEKLEKRIRSRMSHRRILVGVESHAFPVGFGSGGGSGAGDMDGSAANIGGGGGVDPSDRKRRAMDALVSMLRARLEIHPAGVALSQQHLQSQSQSQRQASDSSASVSLHLTMSPTPSPPPPPPQEERKTAGSKRKKSAASAAPAADTNAAPSADSASAAAAAASSSAPGLSPAIVAHNASISRLFSPHSSPALWARLSTLVHVLPSGWFIRVAQWAVAHALGPHHPYLTQRDLVQAIEYALRDWRSEGIQCKCRVGEMSNAASAGRPDTDQLPSLSFTVGSASSRAFYFACVLLCFFVFFFFHLQIAPCSS